jgi:hypothetical protein
VIRRVMLGVATVFEALGATFKKLSVGFTRPPPLLWMLGSYGCWIVTAGVRTHRLDRHELGSRIGHTAQAHRTWGNDGECGGLSLAGTQKHRCVPFPK